MRKLSEAQVNALMAVKADGNPGDARQATLNALQDRGSLVFTGGQYTLTEQGSKELGVPHTAKDTRSDREKYEGTPARFNPEVIDSVHGYALTLNTQDPEDIREGTSITSDGAQAAQTNPDYRGLPAGTDRQVAKAEHFAPGSVILVPRFEAPRLNVTHGHRPASAVQEDRDLLAQMHGADRADEILDTWTLRENRSDRRNGARLDKVEGRRVMRLRRTPSRRRFVSVAGRIRRAERRVDRLLAAMQVA